MNYDKKKFSGFSRCVVLFIGVVFLFEGSAFVRSFIQKGPAAEEQVDCGSITDIYFSEDADYAFRYRPADFIVICTVWKRRGSNFACFGADTGKRSRIWNRDTQEDSLSDRAKRQPFDDSFWSVSKAIAAAWKSKTTVKAICPFIRKILYQENLIRKGGSMTSGKRIGEEGG